MSGIEVAGLVLGALPLLLQGIDSYASSLSRIDQTVNPSRELSKARDRLYLESVIFDNTCRILLAGITSPEEIDALLREPEGKQWKEPSLQWKFEQILDSSSIPAQKAISEIHGAVSKLRKSFYQKVDSQGVCPGPFPIMVRTLRDILTPHCRTSSAQRSSRAGRRSGSALRNTSEKKS